MEVVQDELVEQFGKYRLGVAEIQPGVELHQGLGGAHGAHEDMLGERFSQYAVTVFFDFLSEFFNAR